MKYSADFLTWSNAYITGYVALEIHPIWLFLSCFAPLRHKSVIGLIVWRKSYLVRVNFAFILTRHPPPPSTEMSSSEIGRNHSNDPSNLSGWAAATRRPGQNEWQPAPSHRKTVPIPFQCFSGWSEYHKVRRAWPVSPHNIQIHAGGATERRGQPGLDPPSAGLLAMSPQWVPQLGSA